MAVYYNENDKYCCQWLHNLMRAGHLPEGDIDDRSITDVPASDLAGYDEIHLFAGIGGFALALKWAEWEGSSIVTGGFPCQPFSVAGLRKGISDERYLWPEMLRLIEGRKPEFVLAENVPGIDDPGHMALDRVVDDLGSVGYEVAPVFEVPAGAVGAPHRRNRVWIVAHAERGAAERHRHEMASSARSVPGEARQQRVRADVGDGGAGNGIMAHTPSPELQGQPPARYERADGAHQATDWGLGNACGQGLQVGTRHAGNDAAAVRTPAWQAVEQTSHWNKSEWLHCAFDGKARRVEPGLRLLVDGLPDGMDGRSPTRTPNRVQKLKAFGNAITPQVVAEIARAMKNVCV